VPIALLAAMANLTASQDSTACVQSLFVRTPSVFTVGPRAPPSRNLAAVYGLVPQLHNGSGVVSAYRFNKARGFAFDLSRLDELGVPLDSLSRITSRIQGWVAEGEAADAVATVAEAATRPITSAASALFSRLSALGQGQAQGRTEGRADGRAESRTGRPVGAPGAAAKAGAVPRVVVAGSRGPRNGERPSKGVNRASERANNGRHLQELTDPWWFPRAVRRSARRSRRLRL